MKSKTEIKTKSTHGGRRAGAGRKPAGTKAFMVRLKPGTMLTLRAEALRRGYRHAGQLLDAQFGG